MCLWILNRTSKWNMTVEEYQWVPYIITVMKTTKLRSKQFHYDKHGELTTQNNGKVKALQHNSVLQGGGRVSHGVWGAGVALVGVEVSRGSVEVAGGERGGGVRISHPGATKSACHKHPKLHTHSISSIREPLVCLQNVTG